jgi:hypothetical protein
MVSRRAAEERAVSRCRRCNPYARFATATAGSHAEKQRKQRKSGGKAEEKQRKSRGKAEEKQRKSRGKAEEKQRSG